MRAYVFTDKSLTRHAGRFVWLELNTEKAGNADARKRFGIVGLPTYVIVDPATEKVALRWVGGFTVTQLERLLDDGAAAVAGLPATGPEAALARADRAYAETDYASAARAYEEALAQATPGWAARPRATDALLFSLDQVGDSRGVLRVAREALPVERQTPYAVNVAASGLAAALSLPDTAAGRADAIAEFEAAAREVLEDAHLTIAADDRSGLYIEVLDARKEAKDEAGAKKVAEEWAEFLELQASLARTPEQRTVFDSHRLTAYHELGQVERAIPMLRASERDLPGDYNPPARLAVAYSWLKRWDLALAASDRAMAKAYGPRKLGLYSARADIYAGKGDKAAARRTLEEAIAYGQALPPGQRSESQLAGLRKKLETLS